MNPELGIERTAMYINNETRPWIQSPSRPRRAAVNAFGFGGVNTHAIVEEAPKRTTSEAVLRDWPYELIVLAAASRGELMRGEIMRAGCLESKLELAWSGLSLGETSFQRDNSSVRLST